MKPRTVFKFWFAATVIQAVTTIAGFECLKKIINKTFNYE